MKPSLKGKFERRWIPGYEDLYAVDTNGTIWTYKRSLMGMPLKPRRSRRKSGRVVGYSVSLSKDNVEHFHSVAVLVLTTFVGPKPEGMGCCQYDDIKKNNQLSNLRWDTPRANCQDALRNGKGGHQKLSIKDVKDIRKLLSIGLRTQREIADTYGVTKGCIGNINIGYSWSHI